MEDQIVNEKTATKYYCYLLLSDYGRSYIGFTTDPFRRIRQHNREISGGARCTGINSPFWEYQLILTGYRSLREALRFEHIWKKSKGVNSRFKHGLAYLEDDMWKHLEVYYRFDTEDGS
jgi:structure-specific endonuclease subunit SLX1